MSYLRWLVKRRKRSASPCGCDVTYDRGNREARVGPLAQRLVPTVGGVKAYERHPARVAVEDKLNCSLSHEVLDVLQVRPQPSPIVRQLCLR